MRWNRHPVVGQPHLPPECGLRLRRRQCILRSYGYLALYCRRRVSYAASDNAHFAYLAVLMMRTAISPRFAISKVFNFSIMTVLISTSGKLQIDISISNSIRPRSTSRQAYRGSPSPQRETPSVGVINEHPTGWKPPVISGTPS